MENDVYHNKHLTEPQRWHCNLCDWYVSWYNRSSHEKNNVHKKKVEKNGIMFHSETRKYAKSGGGEFVMGFYTKNPWPPRDPTELPL